MRKRQQGSTTRWRRAVEHTLTPVGAVRAIAGTSLLVAIAGGFLIHLLDREEFPTLGGGLWWAAQTVTTVGYGDAVPEATAGRIVAVYVMLTGVAMIAVATASVTTRLIEGARRRLPAEPEQSALDARLADIVDRLDRIESAMQERRAA